ETRRVHGVHRDGPRRRLPLPRGRAGVREMIRRFRRFHRLNKVPLVPKLLFGNGAGETPFRSLAVSGAETEFREMRSQTGVWERERRLFQSVKSAKSADHFVTRHLSRTTSSLSSVPISTWMSVVVSEVQCRATRVPLDMGSTATL